MDMAISYDTLKEIALREPCSLDFVTELKSLFRNDIISPRRYECIRTVCDLIDCLERKDVISERNVEPLCLLGNKYLDEAVSNYLPPTNANKGVNQYHDMHLTNEFAHKLSINGQHRNICQDDSKHTSSIRTPLNTCSGNNNQNFYPYTLTEQKRAAIYKMISEHLGSHWRMFGRELGIREGTMDEIELQYPRELNTRIYKVLKIFEEDNCNDPKMHLRMIKDALENSRRKDLRRKIDDIIAY
ncbi:fas-associated death domain protein [Ceratitis capitata]|uniref:Death domain-containing adapter protein BG4 n=1 Tax=Ceratitis capitata TaxID=7213 RepID=W8BX82_CERCA|nr:fas-associated death domain protein [Ceratitis capitata]